MVERANGQTGKRVNDYEVAMLKQIRRLDDLAARAEKALVVFIFSAIILLIVFNIIARNLFNVSYQVILEISPALVLWLALLGSTLALKYQRHIRLELIVRFLSPPLQRAARCSAGLFGMVVMGILFAASFNFLESETAMFGYRGWAAVILPIFFAISALRFFIQALEQGTGSGEDMPARQPSPITDDKPAEAG